MQKAFAIEIGKHQLQMKTLRDQKCKKTQTSAIDKFRSRELRSENRDFCRKFEDFRSRLLETADLALSP